jgi:predicted transcriptional regulator of viral defense system
MSELPDTENLLLNQKRLMAITRGVPSIISVAEAATILNMPTRAVAKLMARWTETGSLSRIKRGLYLTVPLKSSFVDVSPVEPWIIAENLFRPCYIGGLSAAAYWGLTDSTVQTNMVLTTQKPRNRRLSIHGITFLLRSISQEVMFGLLPVWKEQCRVQVSDPARTITDFLVDPQLGGGINSVVDVLINYLKSEHKNIELLYGYVKRLYNGAALKRLGFLLEQFDPAEGNVIAFCKILMTSGNVELDPMLSADRLITRWNLWISNETLQIIKNRRHSVFYSERTGSRIAAPGGQSGAKNLIKK